ncbi:monocarboxylate transporter 12-like [Watersipora subatra]|uniref:monocarboxylate transporter 12-like n=1 Tax=Watersipora subatra TaxID=2589382 RepID=UPI00355B6BCF
MEPNEKTDYTGATELIPLTELDEDDICQDSQPIEADGTTEENIGIEEFLPTPPDGGWGWVVVLASFMNHFIVDGISYAFGAFMLEYTEYFKSSAAKTSALMSTLLGCYMLSAPIAGALINKFGCRPVGIAGSILAATSFFVCTFVSSIDAMLFLFGICGGIGFGFMYMPTIISVSMYFEKKRPLALGIAMCGTGVGTFAFAPISKLLLKHYDWKGAHYILAGVIMNGVLFSALMRPVLTKHDRKLRTDKQKRQIVPVKKMEEKKANGLHPASRVSNSLSTKATNARAGMMSHPDLRTYEYGSRLHNSTVHFYHSTHRITSPKSASGLTVQEAENLKRPLYKKDIFYSGSMYHLPEFRKAHNMQEYIVSTTSFPAAHTDAAPKTAFSCRCLPQQIADALSEMLDFNLLKEPSFIIFFVLSMLIMLPYFIPFAFCSVRAKQMGETRSEWLISILGISTMLGRLLSNVIALIPKIKAIYINNVFLLIAGVCCAAIPFTYSFIATAAAAFFYGLFMGANIALTPIILVDLIGLDRLTTGYGLVTLSRGVSTFVGPPLAGQVYDYFSSYDIAFFAAGGLIVFCAMCFFLLELPGLKKSHTQN